MVFLMCRNNKVRLLSKLGAWNNTSISFPGRLLLRLGYQSYQCGDVGPILRVWHLARCTSVCIDMSHMSTCRFNTDTGVGLGLLILIRLGSIH